MMTRRVLIAWLTAAIAGLVIAVWIFQRAFVFYPASWTTTRQQAIDLAMKHFGELGAEVEDPYFVVELDDSFLSEKRLRRALATSDLATLRASSLASQILSWSITVYEAEARPGLWTYKAKISTSDKLLSLRLKIPDDEAGEAIESSRARRRADAFLERMGFDLARFAEPEERRVDRQARTDVSLRYRDQQALLGEETPYGLEVSFVGDELAGFDRWVDNPDQEALEKSQQIRVLINNAWILVPFLLFPVVVFYFLRHYHAGEIGVRRAIQVFFLTFGAGALTIAITARAATEGSFVGPLSRAQVTWAWSIQILIFWFSALALFSAVNWSVGEVRCRERWGDKLAAFDALFKRQWNNATVARASLRGLAMAMLLGAGLLLALQGLSALGVWSGVPLLFGPWWQSAAWSGLTLPLYTLSTHLYIELFCWLFLLPVAVRRFGIWPGAFAVVVINSVLFWSPLSVEPFYVSQLFSLLRGAVLVWLFLRYDLMTTVIASLGSTLLLPALPFLLADAPFLQLQGILPLVVVALPLLLSARHLLSDNEFQYLYEDIPEHVRRIAERERQRVELETARRIQTSILPDLPLQLAGVELAHSYLPASEVGGDFYDVLALDDGRLAVAVGDVAGHGVSSGLIMSMAKSTLALQVTVDPEVEAVLETMNRMVFQSARMRLLTTLCYALVDRPRRQLTYASAGHIAPYRITSGGRVDALSSASYPLGVRGEMKVQLRNVSLAEGDRIFLFSDGVVEACREGSEEPFGFERLEHSLTRHADKGARGLRDGVLEDLRAFTCSDQRDDDQTILVLGLP